MTTKNRNERYTPTIALVRGSWGGGGGGGNGGEGGGGSDGLEMVCITACQILGFHMTTRPPCWCL